MGERSKGRLTLSSLLVDRTGLCRWHLGNQAPGLPHPYTTRRLWCTSQTPERSASWASVGEEGLLKSCSRHNGGNKRPFSTLPQTLKRVAFCWQSPGESVYGAGAACWSLLTANGAHSIWNLKPILHGVQRIHTCAQPEGLRGDLACRRLPWSLRMGQSTRGLPAANLKASWNNWWWNSTESQLDRKTTTLLFVLDLVLLQRMPARAAKRCLPATCMTHNQTGVNRQGVHNFKFGAVKHCLGKSVR